MNSSDNRNSSPDGFDEPPAEFASSPCYLHEFGIFDSDPPDCSPRIFVKRIYEPKSSEDGKRYLIDRLWPRGVSKSDAAFDVWLKELAPSTELRQWFHQQPDDWDEFSRRYVCELKQLKEQENEQLRLLEQQHRAGPVTLLYAARSQTHNHAILLREFLSQHG